MLILHRREPARISGLERIPGSSAGGLLTHPDDGGLHRASEAAERALGGLDFAPHARRKQGEDDDAGEGREQREQPEHPVTLAVRRPADLQSELLEPAVVLQQQMEVEEVVGREGRTDAGLVQLGRQAPHLHAHAARHEQVDDAAACFLRNRALAVGATEAVRAALVVGAHADGEVVSRQLHVTTAWAVGPDRCHRVTRPWSASRSLVRPPLLRTYTLRQGPWGA